MPSRLRHLYSYEVSSRIKLAHTWLKHDTSKITQLTNWLHYSINNLNCTASHNGSIYIHIWNKSTTVPFITEEQKFFSFSFCEKSVGEINNGLISLLSWHGNCQSSSNIIELCYNGMECGLTSMHLALYWCSQVESFLPADFQNFQCHHNPKVL